MRRVVTAIVMMGIFGVQCAFAGHLTTDYDPAEVRCNYGDNDKVIDRLIKQINHVGGELPSIAPEEQHYLDSEFARALKLVDDGGNEPAMQGQQLLHDLPLRPSYDVWHLRGTLGPARLALEQILQRQAHPESGYADIVTYKTNPEAEKLERATHAVYPLSEFTKEVQRYVEKHRSTLTTEENNSFLATSTITYDLGKFISCKLAKVMGRQSLK